MRRLVHPTPAKIAALITACVVVTGYVLGGGRMFSPGDLNAQHHGAAQGGVAAHADLGGSCSACHAEPWSGRTMADRCLDCHADVRRQIDAQLALHGRLPDPRSCRSCHTEHKGDHALLTDLTRFDHAWTGFNLTGKHEALECRSCHADEVYRAREPACVSCHAEPKAHLGQFGTDCARCHSTAAWSGATFKHRFPLNHGRRNRENTSCATCHTNAADYKVYTCYGCHEHEPARVARKHRNVKDLDDCVRCHRLGRERDRERTDLDPGAPGASRLAEQLLGLNPENALDRVDGDAVLGGREERRR
jgi:hypothetical protein